MYLSTYRIKDAELAIQRLHQTFSRESEHPTRGYNLGLAMNNLREAYLDLRQALTEFAMTDNLYVYQRRLANHNTLYRMDSIISRMLGSMATVDDALDITNTLTGFFSDDETSMLESIDFRMKPYITPTPDVSGMDYKQIDVLNRFVQPANGRKVKVLDVYPHEGRTAAHLVEVGSSGKYEIYGVDDNADVLEANRDAFYRLVDGGLNRRAVIPKDTFDVLLDWSPIEENFSTKNGDIEEMYYLSRGFDCLRDDGVVWIALPFFRFNRQMAHFVSTRFKDIHIFMNSPRNLNDAVDQSYKRLVYIIGRKKHHDPGAPYERDNDNYHTLRHLCDSKLPELVKTADELLNGDIESWRMPAGEIEITEFRGAKLSEQEVAGMLLRSNARREFLRDEDFHDSGENRRRPLIPLTTGTLSMALTSGGCDGLVDEGDGHYHIVRGRVVERTRDGRNEYKINNGSETHIVSTITSNEIELTVVQPDGQIKYLIS